MINDAKCRTSSKMDSCGFTLIELMIVLAILAILTVIALPTYHRYAIRVHRTDGQGLLLRIANAQEHFYATHNHYGALTELGYADPAMSEKSYYRVRVAPASASTTQSFIATAEPTGGQGKDDCGSLTITNTTAKHSSGETSNGSCW